MNRIFAYVYIQVIKYIYNNSVAVDFGYGGADVPDKKEKKELYRVFPFVRPSQNYTQQIIAYIGINIYIKLNCSRKGRCALIGANNTNKRN